MARVEALLAGLAGFFGNSAFESASKMRRWRLEAKVASAFRTLRQNAGIEETPPKRVTHQEVSLIQE